MFEIGIINANAKQVDNMFSKRKTTSMSREKLSISKMNNVNTGVSFGMKGTKAATRKDIGSSLPLYLIESAARVALQLFVNDGTAGHTLRA